MLRPANEVFERKYSWKCYGSTSKISGRESRTSASLQIEIHGPGVNEPNLSELMPPIISISAEINPQYCKMTLPFIEAPIPQTHLPSLFVFVNMYRKFFFTSLDTLFKIVVGVN